MAEISQAFSVFAGEATAGLLAFLPLVEIKEGGRRFFQVSVVLALAATGLAHGARAAGGGYAGLELLSPRGLSLGLAALGVILAVAYLMVLSTPSFARARPILIGAAVAATGSLVAESLALPTKAARALVTLDLLGGAALLGSVSLAMVLGHFYLVIPRLSIDPLARLSTAYLVSIALRTVLFGVAVVEAWDRVVPSPLGDRSFLLDATPLLLPRALFGIVGPFILAFLARGTVAIKSTQSATGILYGAMVFVIIGELLGGWLVASTGLPF